MPSGPSTGWGDGWVREEGGLSISGVRQGSLDSIIQLGKKPIQYPEPEQVMDSPGVSGPKLYLGICTRMYEYTVQVRIGPHVHDLIL